MTHILIFVICTIIAVLFGVIGIVCFSNSKKISIATQKKKGLEGEISALQATLGVTKKEEADSRGEKASLDAQIATAKGTLKELEEEIKNAKEDPALSEYNKAKDKIQGDIAKLAKDLGKATSELQQKHQELSDTENKLGRAQQELDTTVKTLNALAADCNEKDKRSKELSQDIEDKQKALRSLEDDLKRLEHVRKELGQAEDALRGLKSDVDALQKRKDDLEKRKDDLEKEIGNLQLQVGQLRGEKEAAEVFIQTVKVRQEKAWEELENHVPAQFNGKKESEENEIKWIEEFNKDLVNAGYNFDRRYINAFHTSLKCADISPLTVLSGVSGTGKSLLPQLYARAAGMHFTILPVQPRWDNPSDLFGFYNYLEGRFKATELSRILYEFGTPEKDTEKDPSMFPMHIVLLDEMNLARVEYYFADFLSKLETRRTDREKAKIMLECGGAGIEAKEIFPWENVLFVGTMNEDETTQTLSDKVIDRANVLRFGPPKKFAGVHKESAGKFKNNYTDLSARKMRDWNNWQRKDGALNNREGLLEMLEGINAAIQKMDRAFAHRVVQSVETYVTNYPGVNGFDLQNEACKNAVSDAIEMKIFPKLNGLDKTDTEFSRVREGIGNQIRNLDAELREAFERDSKEDSSSPFFKWKGVLR